jgi:hypothetical protein
MVQQAPSNILDLLAGRKISQEFLSNLEIIDDRSYPMPGSVTRNPGDPRIHLSSNVAKPHDDVVLAEHLATIQDKKTKRVFVVYRDTVDALFLESQDLKKFPEWLMKDPRKINERSIRINEMLRPPTDKYDKDWLSDDLDDTTYDTLAYFLYQFKTGNK